MLPTPNPRLDPAILSDATALAEAIDVLTRANPQMARHVREILHRQRELQTLASDEAWEAYLHLEAAVNARLADLVSRVARWAFDAGREFERVRRGS